MTNKSNKYFTSDEEYVYVNVPYMEVYIPDELFGDPSKAATVACQYGEGIRSIGIFNIRVFDSEDQNRDQVPIKTFNYPNMIETYPTEYTTEKISINGVVQKCMVLKYTKGDIFMDSYVKKSSGNSEFFLNLLTSGKIPKGVRYDDIFMIWLKNFRTNDVKPGVPYVTLQMIISEMYRYTEDPTVPFRKIAGQNKPDENDKYITANMNEVSSYSSVMSALTFERFSDKLATSINMSKSGVQQTKSPIERVITM